MSKARKGDKSCAGPVVTCPHCSKVGTNNAMRRWHFDNCKELKMEDKKPPKQAIVMRKDLACRKGELMAQTAHASMKVFVDKFDPNTAMGSDNIVAYTFHVTPEEHEWFEGKFTKIVLGCQTEDEIRQLEKDANDMGIPCAVIVDSGKTEFNGVPTVTCIAIGPAKAEDVESLTKQFALI